MPIKLINGPDDPAETRRAINDLIIAINAMGGGNAPAAADLLGSDGSAFTGITLGTNLSFAGATLNAAGGGGTPASPDTSLQFNDTGAFGGSTFNFVADQIVATISHASALGAAIANTGSGGTDGSCILTVVGGTGTAPQFNATITGGVLVSIDGVATAGDLSVVPSNPVSVTSDDAGPLTGATLEVYLQFAPSIIGSSASDGLSFDINGLPILRGGNVFASVTTDEAGLYQNAPGVLIRNLSDDAHLTVASNGNNNGTNAEFIGFNDGNEQPTITLLYGRGSIQTPENVHNGDFLGFIGFGGFDTLSGNVKASSYIYAAAASDWTSGSPDSKLHLGTSLDAIVIDQSANTSILNGGLVVGTPAGGSQGVGTIAAQSGLAITDPVAIGALPASPSLGMIRVVNDALAPAVGVQVAAMGAANAGVWWNGAQWTVWGV